MNHNQTQLFFQAVWNNCLHKQASTILTVSLCALGAMLVFIPVSMAQDSAAKSLEEVSVIGVSPLQNVSPSPSSQSADAANIAQLSRQSFAEFLEHQMQGVTLNHAQNNPLQPDLQYRGFAASPALGLQQGLTVYHNGARINEPFGDTLNWDLLAQNTIDRVSLVSGVNPLFGLNSLGGALALQTKTGFSSPETQLSASTGSFSRNQVSLSTGGHEGSFGHFVSLDYWDEEGWRDFSESEAINFYAAGSWRLANSKVDLFYNHADTDLKGNGASPVELLDQDRAAVFTHPDQTENQLNMLNLVFSSDLDSHSSIKANAFYRRTKTSAFNGDGSTFSECEPDELDNFLCFGDDDDDDDDELDTGEIAEEDDDHDEEEVQLALDQNGQRVSADFNAINNLSEREQTSIGGNLEYSSVIATRSGIRHNLIAGLSYLYADARFSSEVEFAMLNDDRSTTRSALFDPTAITQLTSDSTTIGVYLSDTLEVTEHLDVGFGMRYNSINIESKDLSGQRPDLNAENRFSRLNFGINGIWRPRENLRMHAALGQSMRSPSPVELACSHPEAPCTLPNTFLADPPLDEVVSTTLELGITGSFDSLTDWRVVFFNVENKDDILFQTTGGVSSNVGFFDNISDTRRVGIEAALQGSFERFSWYANYTYLRATFEDEFFSSSPNHPMSDEGGIRVARGSRIPSLPEHDLVVGVYYQPLERLTFGLQTAFVSGQYLRGDEANLTEKTEGYSVTDIDVRYQFNSRLTLGLQVENVFDEEYDTFGLFGEPDEIFEEFDNPRFLSSSAPRGAWVRLAYRW